MNQLRSSILPRASRKPSFKPDVRQKLTAVCAVRPASFHECLEMALSRPKVMQWGGVQEMVHVIHQKLISPEEALKILKPYVRSNMSTVVLKTLTIVDTLVFNCGEKMYTAMLVDKWHTRLTRLTAHLDNKVKQAALQLISNYSQTHNGTEFGKMFVEIAVSLTTKGFTLPGVLSPSIKYETKPIDSANIEESFVKGIDFLEYQFLESSTAQNSDGEQTTQTDETSDTIHKIERDVQKLVEAIAACHKISKLSKIGQSSKKAVLDSLNMAWVVAEKCNVWSENMQGFLTKHLEKDELTHLLMANDALNDALRSWEVLVSMDIINGSESESDDASLQRPIIPLRGVVDSIHECESSSNKEVEALRSENERLRAAVAAMEQAQKEEMLNMETKHKSELRDMKRKAASRIKDLLHQIRQLQHTENGCAKEEGSTFQSGSGDAILSTDVSNVVGNGTLHIAVKREASLSDSARIRFEFEKMLQEKTTLVESLNAQLSTLQEELEEQKAAAKVQLARFQANTEQLTQQAEQLTTELSNSQSAMDRLQEQDQLVANLKLELKRESILRKKAFNHIRELKGNIQVIARIRPTQNGLDLASRKLDAYTIEHIVKSSASAVSHRPVGNEIRRYEFDACLGPEATQANVFEETQHLIQSALDGYNVCIFCYGQTGSGKTHTLTGSKDDTGILPRFTDTLFTSDTAVMKASAQCYMLELYQDDLVDLLSPTSKKTKMSIGTDTESGMVTVKGATRVDVRCAADMKSLFEAGVKKRTTATTRCNINSSRSHLIFTVLLERVNVITGSRTKSKITFIDLAGSERVVKSGAVNDKERLNEAKAINKSLSALGDVVSALTSKESFIPYRNHKLTELMRDSLGGNAKTLMIVNISPNQSDAKETQNSLDYAQRTKQVTNEQSRSYETRELAKLKAVNEKQAREIQQLRSMSARPS